MPKNNARIGKDDERQIVKDLEARGYRARRQPGSGNRAVDLQHDVLWHDSPAGKLHIEGKYREACQWKVLEKWRAGADILTVRCDGRRAGQDGQRMAFLSWDLLLELVGHAALQCTIDDVDLMIKGLRPSAEREALSEKAQNVRKQINRPKAKIPQRANPWPKRGARSFNKGAAR